MRSIDHINVNRGKETLVTFPSENDDRSEYPPNWNFTAVKPNLLGFAVITYVLIDEFTSMLLSSSAGEAVE